jgi:hypothetical protein
VSSIFTDRFETCHGNPASSDGLAVVGDGLAVVGDGLADVGDGLTMAGDGLTVSGVLLTVAGDRLASAKALDDSCRGEGEGVSRLLFGSTLMPPLYPADIGRNICSKQPDQSYLKFSSC